MDQFLIYLNMGFEHIADLNAYDHILFILALCAIYRAEHWKKMLVLITAFTIGHSLTLALSALEIFVVPSNIVEFLIPVTIFLTCIYNIFEDTDKIKEKKMNFNYFLALFFGLIHGLGFSNYFKMIFSETGDIIFPLFSFNLGLEIGQILIVGIIFSFMAITIRIFKYRFRDWVLFISGIAAGMSIILMKETAFWV